MEKYAHIPQIEGVVFSDPAYDETVWCQYRKDFRASSWYLKMDTAREDDLILFKMSMGRCTMAADTNITMEEDTYQIAFPERYETDHAELGMDTAAMYCGSKKNWDMFSEEAALRTGTDGIFGNLFIFTCKGETDPVGFILTGAVDPLFIREDDLFASILSSFDGNEISKDQYLEATDRSNLTYRLLHSQEMQSAHPVNNKKTPGKEPGPNR